VENPKSTPAGDASRPIVGAIGHPVRVKVLVALGERSGSANEIAERTDVPVRAVRHHLSELRKAGLIESVEAKTRRGVVEHSYRLIVPALIGPEEFDGLSGTEKLHTTVQVLKLSYLDVSVALAAGTMDARPERCVIYARVLVDSQGWRELAEVHDKALEEVERVRAESAERLRSGDEKPIRGVSTLLWFELPGL
jgi:DNA-binding transcriptional ArsR family regulator